MTLQVGHQLRPRSSRRRGETIMKWDIMRRNNLGIWKNIGKIVILIFQIIHEQVKWTIHSWSRVKRNSPMDKTHEGMEALHNMSIPQQEKYDERTTRIDTKSKDDITFI